MLVAGDTGHGRPRPPASGDVRSTRFELHERVRRANVGDHVADLTVEPMAAGGTVTAELPAPDLGPRCRSSSVRSRRRCAIRSACCDGRASSPEATRSPSLLVRIRSRMPQLGSGPLGRHLLAQARRLGPGEFHSLREYVDGDEPRSIHWRASARGEALLVKQHAVEGLRRMLVVLDTDPASYADPSSFERAITVAASLVHSAAQADLVTRFVSGDVDLRGPDVAADALRILAGIQPATVACPASTANRARAWVCSSRSPGHGRRAACARRAQHHRPDSGDRGGDNRRNSAWGDRRGSAHRGRVPVEMEFTGRTVERVRTGRAS